MIRKSVRRLLEMVLEKTDYHLVPKGASGGEHAAFVDHLSTLLRTLHIDCVFDVGANRGGFRHFMRTEVGYDGLIFSFEPVSHLAEVILAASASDPSWHTFHLAIGDVAGMMPINVTRNDQLSSFLRPSSAATDWFAEMSSVDHVEDATVRTLADVYAELQATHGFKRPYLKIDTQGFDLKVIRGAGEYLARFLAMQTELCIIPIYEEQPTYAHVLDLLNQAGFAISGMYPVVRDPLLRIVELDCVLVQDVSPRLHQGEPEGA